MTELEPTEAIRTQMKNRAAGAACCELLDKRGHGDAYGPDDALDVYKRQDQNRLEGLVQTVTHERDGARQALAAAKLRRCV